MNPSFGFSGDREDIFVRPETPRDTGIGIIFRENMARIQQESPINNYLEIMRGIKVKRDIKPNTESHINLPKNNRLLTPMEENAGTFMIGTSGTSKSVREEMITSFESILPAVLDKLLIRNTGFRCANKSLLNERLVILAKRASLDVLKSLTPDEIERRVEKILAVEFAISTFSDLSPEQKKILEE